MELFQISKNELKITLSTHDLEEFDLTVPTMDYSTTKTRKAIWEIFDRAKKQLGFDAAKSKLKIEVFPLSDGGCDMYVSRLSVEAGRLHAVKPHLNYVPQKHALIFDTFGELCTYCALIPKRTQSSLYYDSRGRYILLMVRILKSPLKTDVFPEFGNLLGITYIEPYLNERCTLICEKNAVSKISESK